MTLDGLKYDPEDCRIGVSSGHSIIHVTVWHPHWGSAQTAALRAGIFGGVARETVPDLEAAEQMLTAALGSEVVATRIGTIEVTDHCPDRGITMDELREVLHKMEPNTSISNGEPAWTSLRMFVDGEDVEVKAVSPLSPVISPGSDVHVLAVAQIDPVSAAHLTGAQIIDQTGEVEDALTSTVADTAAGVLVAVVHASNSVKLHFYLNSALPGLDSVINTLRAVLSTWDVGEASLSRDEDPQWRAVRAFRV